MCEAIRINETLSFAISDAYWKWNGMSKVKEYKLIRFFSTLSISINFDEVLIHVKLSNLIIE